MKRAVATAASVAGLAALAHVGPAATWIPGVRRRLFPRLAGHGRPGHLALTFDDGPDRKSTPAIISELDKLGWRATFFMLGVMVDRDRGLAREVAASGNEIALHGYLHVNHLARTPLAVLDDLRQGFDTVSAATGTVPSCFRPPYGVLSTSAVLASRLIGIRPVLWSAWGKDWTDHTTGETVLAELYRGLESVPEGAGPTVLLHDSDCTSEIAAWHATRDVLMMLDEWAASHHMAVGPLCDHWRTPEMAA